MKCRIAQHFIRVSTVCFGKIELQRKKYNIFWDPLVYTLDHQLCANPESFFFRGVQLLLVNEWIQIPLKSKGVPLACRWWHNTECSLSSFVIFRGIQTPLYVCDFSDGSGPPVPPLDPHMETSMNQKRVKIVKCLIGRKRKACFLSFSRTADFERKSCRNYFFRSVSVIGMVLHKTRWLLHRTCKKMHSLVNYHNSLSK